MIADASLVLPEQQERMEMGWRKETVGAGAHRFGAGTCNFLLLVALS